MAYHGFTFCPYFLNTLYFNMFTYLFINLLIGKDLAEQSEILETVGEQDPSEFYYGQGQDED